MLYTPLLSNNNVSIFIIVLSHVIVFLSRIFFGALA
jgi:hypothetical protein